MEPVSFTAFELLADGSFREADYTFEGSVQDGWIILRQGKKQIELPPGYDLLRTVACGICSTDQARRFLPFPLPQIIGHEVVAEDEAGRAVAAEINASHLAADAAEAAACPLCSARLPTHCPDRMVLGIDRLPGGFGPFILVPRKNIIPIPAALPLESAVLLEPFAAALHAAETIDLDDAATVAVFGTGRLGLLIVAALKAIREERGLGFDILARENNRMRADLALRLGADRLMTDKDRDVDAAVECTGSQGGLEAALSAARREVHVKSTTGLETMGFRFLTEMVVDEIGLAPYSRTALESLAAAGARTALLAEDDLPSAVAAEIESCGLEARSLSAADLSADGAPRYPDQADVVVATSCRGAEQALRPWDRSRQGFVRPRGTILVAAGEAAAGDLIHTVAARGLRISTSRCGDFTRALPMLEKLIEKGIDLGRLLITHRFEAGDLPAAMAAARNPDAVKVVVEH